MTPIDSPDAAAASAPTPAPACPKCGGEMWDNRESKRNPRAPDFKCKDRSCDGVIWPPRTANAGAVAGAGAAAVPNVNGAKAAGGGVVATAAAAGPSCPICGGPMWDDRATKRNPKAPDFKCKNKPKVRGGPGCEGVIWPPRDGKASSYPQPAQRLGGASGGAAAAAAAVPAPRPRPPAYDEDDVSLPPPPPPPPAYDAPPHDDSDAPGFEEELPF